MPSRTARARGERPPRTRPVPRQGCLKPKMLSLSPLTAPGGCAHSLPARRAALARSLPRCRRASAPAAVRPVSRPAASAYGLAPAVAVPAQPLYPKLVRELDFDRVAVPLKDTLISLALGCNAAAALYLRCPKRITALGRNAPAVAAVALGCLVAAVLYNVCRDSALQERLLPVDAAADEDSKFRHAGGARLHYKLRLPTAEQCASSRTFLSLKPQLLLVCLHGFGANEASFSLRGALDGLAARCVACAIAVDAPGFGLTPRTDRVGDYTVDSAAAAVDALADYVIAEQCERGAVGKPRRIFIGHSVGALTAVRAAQIAKARGEEPALVLIAPAILARGYTQPSPSEPPTFAPAMTKLRAAAWIAARLLAQALFALLSFPFLGLLRRLVRSPVFWARGLAKAYVDGSKVDADLVDAYRRPSCVKAWDMGLLRFIAARAGLAPLLDAEHLEPPLPSDGLAPSPLGPAAVLAALAASGVKVLIVHGDRDGLVPLSNSERLAANTPGALLAVLPEVGHSPQEEAVEAFLAAVVPFIRGAAAML